MNENKAAIFLLCIDASWHRACDRCTVRRAALPAIYLHCSPTVWILEVLIKRFGY